MRPGPVLGSPLPPAAPGGLPLPLLCRGRSQGVAQAPCGAGVPPRRFDCLQACGLICNVPRLNSPSQEVAARRWPRHIWFRRWRGWLPPRTAFSRNPKKPKEAPNNAVWWGSKRVGTPPLGASRFSPAGMQNASLWLLPTAMPLPAGCLRSDAGCWRRGPPCPHPHHAVPPPPPGCSRSLITYFPCGNIFFS